MRQMVKKFMTESEIELNKLAKNCGFKVAGVSATYENDGSGFSVKFKFESADEKAKEEKRKKDFNALCSYYGFQPSDYKATVIDGNEIMQLVGFNPKARKNPCILTSKSGKEYVAPTSYVIPRMKK